MASSARLVRKFAVVAAALVHFLCFFRERLVHGTQLRRLLFLQQGNKLVSAYPIDLVEYREHALRGELILVLAVCINSLGVVLMLYSGAGISAISSVPFAFSEVFPKLTLGTWTYLFQGLLVLSLMVMRRRFVPPYLFSFVVGFVFGELLDVHELWIGVLPTALPWRILYFVVSYVLICIGIALSNRCGLPIVPTDLFPRELSDITGVDYPKIKIGFDVICLAVTAGMTFFCLGHLDGLGIGTIVAAFTMGKGVGICGNWMDKRFQFTTFLEKRKERMR